MILWNSMEVSDYLKRRPGIDAYTHLWEVVLLRDGSMLYVPVRAPDDPFIGWAVTVVGWRNTKTTGLFLDEGDEEQCSMCRLPFGRLKIQQCESCDEPTCIHCCITPFHERALSTMSREEIGI